MPANEKVGKSYYHKCSLSNQHRYGHWCQLGSLAASVEGIQRRPDPEIKLNALEDQSEIQHLKSMIEKASKASCYNSRAVHLDVRDIIIRFIEAVTTNQGYSLKTYYLSIAITDRLMSTLKLKNDTFDLVCFLALNAAAKLNERSSRIPGVEQIVDSFGGRYSSQKVREAEISILVALEFKINLVTVYDLTQSLLNIINPTVASNDLGSQDSQQDRNSMFTEAVLLFVEFSSNHYEFLKFASATVAGSCIFGARKMLKMEPYWPSELEKLLGVSEADIELCADIMRKLAIEAVGSLKIAGVNKKDTDILKCWSPLSFRPKDAHTRSQTSQIHTRKRQGVSGRNTKQQMQYNSFKDLVS